MFDSARPGAWGIAACLVLTALLAGFLVLTASMDGDDAASSGNAPSSLAVESSLWASIENSYLGFTLRVDPPEEDSGDEYWYIYAGLAADCIPQETKSEWRFMDCEVFDNEEVTDFEVTLPKASGRLAEVRLEVDGKRYFTQMARVPLRDEAVPSSNVDLVWSREWDFEDEICFSRTGIWSADGLVFAPCTTGEIEILDQKTGDLVSTVTQDGAEGDDDSAALEVAARNGLLYVATSDKGVLIFDVTDPKQPKLLGQFFRNEGRNSPQSVINIHNLTLSPKGDLLFVINTTGPGGSIRIVDVKDPRSPREVGRILPPSTHRAYPHDIALEERDGKLIAYVNFMFGPFQLFDVTNPAEVKTLGSIRWPEMVTHSGAPFSVGNRRYFAHTDEGYDAPLTVLDVTDMTKISVVSTFRTRPGISIHNLRVIDGIAYISYYIDGLRVVDLRDPAKPREIAHYDTVKSDYEYDLFDGAWGIYVDGGQVYLSDRSSGVYAFKVTLPK